MALLDWFAQLAARLYLLEPIDSGPASVPPTLPGPPPDTQHLAELDGLDFGQAIRAHQLWKRRLVDVLDGARDKRFDLASIDRPDLSELGRWLHGPGQAKYGHLPIFQKLLLSHRAFHVAAADVLAMHQAGHVKAAREMIERGLYAKFSVRVQGLLAQFFLDRSGRVTVRFPKAATLQLTRPAPL
jgi:hypothetical protein